MVFFTQIMVFYGLPWLEWGQRQAVLFDLGRAASTFLAWSCTRRTSSI
jgi:polyferredoxin